MSLHDLRSYKESKIALPHIKAILQVFELTEKSLTHFSSYRSVAKVLMTIADQRAILESYQIMYNKINKEKGEKITK